MKKLRLVHRWASLMFFLFWIIQATSGAFLVFHREIDDWTLQTDGDRPLNLSLLVHGIAKLETERNATATSLFSSTGYSMRYDVYLESRTTNVASVARVDGHGRLLRERGFNSPAFDGGIYLAANRIHRHLLAGPTGAWIVRISGILLVTNIVVGLTLAWPKRSHLRRVLLPGLKHFNAVAVFGLHRAIGLWMAPFALIVVSFGVLLAFEGDIARLLGAKGDGPIVLSSPVPVQTVTHMEAIRAAMVRYPNAEFTGVLMPFDGSSVYSVFLRQPTEADQAFGATRVFVDGSSGEVVGTFDPLSAGRADSFISYWYPLHTGQIGGWTGRVAVMAIGLWLIGMIALGSILWWLRRRQSARHEASN